MWLGRVDGAAIGTSLSFVQDGVIGVYGVAVVPEARRRGYGEALSWVATLARPELPAVLQASEEGDPLYRRMGYRQAGTFAHWSRPVRP